MQQCAAPQAECRAPHKRVAEPCRAVPCRARDLILGRRIFQTHRKAALSTLQWPRWPHSLGWPAVNLASIKSCHGIIGFWTRLIVCVCVCVCGGVCVCMWCVGVACVLLRVCLVCCALCVCGAVCVWCCVCVVLCVCVPYEVFFVDVWVCPSIR